MKNDLNKTKEQLSFELNDLRNKSKEREEKLKAINQQLRAANQQLEAYQQQLIANEQQLRAANQQLAASEEKFRIVLDHTYNWEYWIDPKGKFIYVSPSCERITGYTQNEFLQNPKLITEIVHPDDLAMVKGHRHKVFENEKIEEIEFRIITKSKKERWIGHICQTIYDDNGNNIGQRGSNRDITERKQAEEALQESEEKYRTFINTASDLMCITDEEGKFTEVNESMINKLEYSRNELIGNHFRTILTKESIEKDLLPNWDKFIENGKISIETTFLSKKGNELYCVLKSIGIYDDNNKFIGSRAVIHDLTQRKQAEETLQESEEKFRILTQTSPMAIMLYQKDKWIFLTH